MAAHAARGGGAGRRARARPSIRSDPLRSGRLSSKYFFSTENHHYSCAEADRLNVVIE
jgi:hypothetical protein